MLKDTIISFHRSCCCSVPVESCLDFLCGHCPSGFMIGANNIVQNCNAACSGIDVDSEFKRSSSCQWPFRSGQEPDKDGDGVGICGGNIVCVSGDGAIRYRLIVQFCCDQAGCLNCTPSLCTASQQATFFSPPITSGVNGVDCPNRWSPSQWYITSTTGLTDDPSLSQILGV